MEADLTKSSRPAAVPAEEQEGSARRGFLAIQVIYVLVISLWSMSQGIFPSPELLLVLLASVFVWRARSRAFLADFIPFILLLVCYQALRGFADELAPTDIHVMDLIAWERALFGGIIPAVYLQATLLDRWFTPILDMLANLFYMSHFLVQILLALIIWHRKRMHYWPFVAGLVGLSYVAFIVYVLFPAAPPWWATLHGYLPDGAVMLTNFVLPTVVVFAGPNPVAAMPSLHAAYPTYLALFVVAIWGRRMLPVWILPFGVALSSVYLGHHYVVDLIAGMLFAAVAFALAWQWSLRRARP